MKCELGKSNANSGRKIVEGKQRYETEKLYPDNVQRHCGDCLLLRISRVAENGQLNP
jgi:hypothetical protein